MVLLVSTFIIALAITGGNVVVQTNKRVGVCLTPKIASSIILDYLLWFEVGPPAACKFNPIHIPAARSECIMPGKSNRYRVKNFPLPLRGLSIQAYKTRPVDQTLILYRDPWIRLISGFRSKVAGMCNFNATCVKLTYISTMSLSNKQNLLMRYFSGVKKLWHHKKFNPHFSPQTDMCLSLNIPNSTYINIDNVKSLDTISEALGHFGNASTSALFHPYDWTRYKDRCYPITKQLLIQVMEMLEIDYQTLTKYKIQQHRHVELVFAIRQAMLSCYIICINNNTITASSRHTGTGCTDA